MEQTVRGTNIRLYYPEYWTEGDPRLDSMGVIMDAAQKSVEQYNGYGPDPINTVYMVYTDLPYRETSTSRFETDVFAAAYNADFSNPAGRLLRSTCRIGIFPYGLEGSPESLQQTIAHEMFHCYQYKNLREQTLNLPNAIIDWWKEGSAEFFGATVYPDNNDEFISMMIFRLLSQAQPCSRCPTKITCFSNSSPVKAVLGRLASSTSCGICRPLAVSSTTGSAGWR